MAKSKLIYTMFLLIIILSGCSNSAVDTVGKIITPQNKLMPIEGKWEIERGLNSDFTEMTDEVMSKWIGNTVQFSAESVFVGGDLFNEPQYKIKRVNTDDYLLYRHKQPAEKYGIKNSDIYVITIAVKELYSFDALVIDNEKLIIEFEDYILYLKKLSDNVDNSINNKLNENNENIDSSLLINDFPARTGLVLGLKYIEKDSRGEAGYKYRTLWIGAEDKKLRTTMETMGIFFPRHDGFWRIETKRIYTVDRREDIFYAHSVLNGSTEELINITINPEKWGDKTGSISRSISYVGNDYIGIESIGEGGYIDNSDKWSENRLQLQLVDNLPNLRGIKIFDIAGETGIRAINNGKTEALGLLDLGKINQLGMVQQDENYSLYRKAGHWLFKGRLNYKSEEGYRFSDFNINIIPPSELVFYDDLWVSWTQIKDRVPEAIDAYTSPNKDIAIIVTRDRILIYEILKGTLGEVPLKRINLKNGETVIMAEWANGSYMDNWEKSFMKNNVSEVK